MARSIQLPVHLPLPLTALQCRTYEQLAASVLQRNAVDFDDHIERTTHNLPVDARRWRLLKSRRRIDIYRSQEQFQPDVFAPSFGSVCAPASRAPLASLLCAGTLDGSLDDAMLGSATPTQLAMATRSLYLKDEFIQHEVLHNIKPPTHDAPFAYLGLKWALRSSPVSAIVSERDLVYVEATGFHELRRANGQRERIGYIINHSVELPELPPLAAEGVVRAKFSLCILCRQAAPGVVQVYATIFSDPGGHLPAKLAALSAASALNAVSRGMDCTLGRTLVWLFKKRLHQAPAQEAASSKTGRRGKWWCGQCTRELSSYRRRAVCCICQAAVCSRCIHTKRLALGPTAHELRFVPVPVCSGCLATARGLHNAAEVAMDEMSCGPERRRSEERLLDAVHRHTLVECFDTEPSAESIEEIERRTRSAQYSAYSTLSTRDTTDTITADDDSTESEYYCGSQYSSQASSPRSWTSSQPTFEVERQQMLLMMSKLRLQAEETYSATMSMASASAAQNDRA